LGLTPGTLAPTECRGPSYEQGVRHSLRYVGYHVGSGPRRHIQLPGAAFAFAKMRAPGRGPSYRRSSGPSSLLRCPPGRGLEHPPRPSFVPIAPVLCGMHPLPVSGAHLPHNTPRWSYLSGSQTDRRTGAMGFLIRSAVAACSAFALLNPSFTERLLKAVGGMLASYRCIGITQRPGA
jgi:hypothetical protein